ncbi:MAG: exodeoxyribonuclease VII small subunit [Bacillota bacterium]|jgi:exodeoxyribonuclease VII small subunit
MADKMLSFEDALNQLDKKVKALEAGNLSLEEMLKTFEEGVGLIRICHHRLNEAEQRIEFLLKDIVDEESNPTGERTENEY